MWTLLAFVSALCLGCYDVSKKIALRGNRVVDVLTLSVCVSAALLSVPLLLSRLHPEWMSGTPLMVPELDWQAHLYTLLKSVIVLSSWVFAFVSLKHLPISVVSPMQATRPMWTLIGALLLFGERLNAWQWTGVLLAIGTVFVYSLANAKPLTQRHQHAVTNTQSPTRSHQHAVTRTQSPARKYYICLALAILIGACSGLYDKYLMRRYDHNAVQVYYTLYQAVMMIMVWAVVNRKQRSAISSQRSALSSRLAPGSWLPVMLISVFLVLSDNVYMLALRDPDSMIAIVSTIRRGGTVIGFAYGLLFLKESNPLPKLLCMLGILAGLLCLAMGAV